MNYFKTTALVCALFLVSFVTYATEGNKNQKKNKPQIEIVNFSTSYNAGNAVAISCQIKSNCCYNLIVERSKNGKKFTEIGTFSENKGIADHALVDEDPNNVTNYYRLKLVDDEGNVSYSNLMVSQLYTKRDVVAMVNVTPITKDKNLEVTVSLKERAIVSLKVLDAKGNEVLSEKVSGEAGENMLEITKSKELTAGNYTLEVYVNNTNQLILPLIKK